MVRAALAILLLVYLATDCSANPSSDADLLASAEQAFAQGIALRTDAVKARPAFAQSAAAYDELWRRNHHNPELALNRAHAHRLAGNLPAAIVALHEGLEVTRWNRSLQVALEDARGTVAYPLVGNLATQCRPTHAPSVSARMSPTEAWFLAGFLWLLVWVGLTRFAMTRTVWYLAFVGLAFIALVLLGLLWRQDHRNRADEALPLVVVASEATLRRGNAEGFPARLENALPAGTEARELNRRGGWLQVQLASGVVGWLPRSAVLVNETADEAVG